LKKIHFIIAALATGLSLIAFPLALIRGEPPQIVLVTVLTSIGATIVATTVSLLLGRRLKS